MAFISLVAGTLSVISSFICNWFAWYVTAFFSLSGIITGIIGVKYSKFKSVSKAGIILSSIGIALTVILIIAFNFIHSVFLSMNV